MDVADFDFELPEELIAQDHPAERGESRLLVLGRKSGEIHDAIFTDVGSYLQRGDLLVLPNTRVFPARLLGRRVPSGGAVECLLIGKIPTSDSERPNQLNNEQFGSQELASASSEIWDALMHPGQKLKPGARVSFERDGLKLHGEVLAAHFFGRRTVRLWTEEDLDVRATIDRLGHIPLPPYIRREDRPSDRERYQTVYARERGSIAAPTAGLHFTTAAFNDLRTRGVDIAEVTLHVGYGTFKPVRADKVEDHVVDAEALTVTPEVAAAVTSALRDRRRVIAVGTTTTRALESLRIEGGRVLPTSGATDLFIRPGHVFNIVSGLITNFHLPRSSLLMLVAAFAGRDRVLAAYRHAIASQYRFYSYGDAMLIV